MHIFITIEEWKKEKKKTAKQKKESWCGDHENSAESTETNKF